MVYETTGDRAQSRAPEMLYEAKGDRAEPRAPKPEMTNEAQVIERVREHRKHTLARIFRPVFPRKLYQPHKILHILFTRLHLIKFKKAIGFLSF